MSLTRGVKNKVFHKRICTVRTLVRVRKANFSRFPWNFPHFILFHRGSFPEFPHSGRGSKLSTKGEKFSSSFSLLFCGKWKGGKISHVKGFRSFPIFRRALRLLPLPYLNFSYLFFLRKKKRLRFFAEWWKTFFI